MPQRKVKDWDAVSRFPRPSSHLARTVRCTKCCRISNRCFSRFLVVGEVHFISLAFVPLENYENTRGRFRSFLHLIFCSFLAYSIRQSFSLIKSLKWHYAAPLAGLIKEQFCNKSNWYFSLDWFKSVLVQNWKQIKFQICSTFYQDQVLFQGTSKIV